MLVIALEGNIGVGKSTVWERLRRLYDGDERVTFVAEPVAEWEELGFLQRMYAEPSSKAAFQLAALVSLTADLSRAMRGPAQVVITERSPWGNYETFAKHTLGSDDLAMYEYAWRRLVDLLPAALHRYIYLRAPVAVLESRVRSRGRGAEEGLPRGYLEALSALHDAWLLAKPGAYQVDASQPAVDVYISVADKVNEWIEENGD